MNNFNIIRINRTKNLLNFYPVYHSPLVFDINTQRHERKPGYVAWPEEMAKVQIKDDDGKLKKRHKAGPYFAYPQK